MPNTDTNPLEPPRNLRNSDLLLAWLDRAHEFLRSHPKDPEAAELRSSLGRIADEIHTMGELLRAYEEWGAAPRPDGESWTRYTQFRDKAKIRRPQIEAQIESSERRLSLLLNVVVSGFRRLQRSDGGVRRKAMIKSVSRGIITTATGKEVPFKKKTAKTALLCEKVYAHCRRIGDAIAIERIYREVWEDDYQADPLKNWKRVDSAVRNVNAFAVNHGLVPLLHCTTEYVERLA